ncbi:ATP-binding cassette domain-containing protein [Pedobacter changchengzhani]|uniref:ATP-binding cassette domain-containing protein n=1 Tax=Pedobacter changchengzhani TaxID=2529274 RepID=A0A4R5MIC3_9SPHI|nr:ABC transporter ATP-binding protein [Pedobacter changchengzhani]TDG35308.1 ATP-binding cassette domain-containing protein [Pedobacter changchengzhani]
MNLAIKAENLSKAYQLGQIGTGTISKDLERWYASIRGKEDPFLKIGETNDQRSKSSSDLVWSLKDINFEIEQGDAVGIIGRNGAGKSTLLKILSKVTAPTTGKISGRGRIASLLEVGTGFHPELSGRENIFLNGAILGMRIKEIQRKLEEIVDFAGIERYLDTPVKRYSSGMYVRLAFAVAAHLESEILIVDEVLAVGDAEFQKKCLGKMNDVSKGEGRTVLFVSHNMDSITRLCEKGILLKNGRIQSYDQSSKVIDSYLRSDSGTTSTRTWSHRDAPKNSLVELISVKAHDANYVNKEFFDITESVGISMKYQVFTEGYIFHSAFNFFNGNGVNIFDAHEYLDSNNKPKQIGTYEVVAWLPKNLFSEGNIIIGAAILTQNPFVIHLHEMDVIVFNMVDQTNDNPTRGHYVGSLPGIVRPLLEWSITKI